ncbi:hypothetical protein QBC39DRAFT_358263 [Podospora conica]|nr:hypothetical protein QBC39DRAFT_358263 [Schizothecium conicum]
MEAAGVALGVAALFSTCVQSFDIIVRSREFGNEFDLLCTQLSLLQIRLKIWGESLGLVPESRIVKTRPYNTLVDHPEVRPSIEQALFHLHRLLTDADVVTNRYSPEEEGTDEGQPAVSKGLTVFKNSFDTFKQRIRRNQKEQSTWKVTKWAIRDLGNFKALITKIKDLIEALEGITIPLGSLLQHEELLAYEVSLVSDTDSLRLLAEVSSTPGSSWSLRVVCDSSSFRLTPFTNSGYSIAGKTADSRVASSCHTAPKEPSGTKLVERTLHQAMKAATSVRQEAKVGEIPGSVKLESSQRPPSRQNIPQNQRIMLDIMKDGKFVAPEPSFASGAARHGLSMAQIKTRDGSAWANEGLGLLLKADTGGSVARRVFLELRSIKAAGIPFISARTLGDRMDKILASIEGPPDTPYEGGIFWLQVHYHTAEISQAPVLRFITRVYHPNIDCLGNICADYQAWWSDSHLKGSMARHHINPATTSWFSTKSCLASILTAICGLLASPNVEDPLVPEIAETYVKDYRRYCEIAASYTRSHAQETEVDERYILSVDETNGSNDDGKRTVSEMSNAIKDSNAHSTMGGSRVHEPSEMSSRKKEKLLNDDEAGLEKKALEGLKSYTMKYAMETDVDEQHVLSMDDIARSNTMKYMYAMDTIPTDADRQHVLDIARSLSMDDIAMSYTIKYAMNTDVDEQHVFSMDETKVSNDSEDGSMAESEICNAINHRNTHSTMGSSCVHEPSETSSREKEKLHNDDEAGLEKKALEGLRSPVPGQAYIYAGPENDDVVESLESLDELLTRYGFDMRVRSQSWSDDEQERFFADLANTNIRMK